jgi:hypothetical protein
VTRPTHGLLENAVAPGLKTEVATCLATFRATVNEKAVAGALAVKAPAAVRIARR